MKRRPLGLWRWVLATGSLALGFPAVVSCDAPHAEAEARRAPKLSAASTPDERPAPAPEADLSATSPWNSRQACLQSLASRTAARGPRLASFNVRWFPDGNVDTHADGTDIEWLACVMLHLDASVVAVQEFREGDAKSRSVSTLLSALGRLGGGSWDAAFDGCPGNRQHVGFIFNKQRVTAEGYMRLDSLNPKGGCEGLLRPGFAGYFRFTGGPDLHVVSVHLKSGTQAKDRSLRTETWRGLGRAYATLQERFKDSDVVILGDLNTMGGPGTSAAEELAELDQTLSRQTPTWRRVNASAPCSQISRGRGALLDHVVVTQSAQELSPSTVTQVAGLCRELGCRRIDKELPALAQLSDHCPLSVELVAEDADNSR
jgi:endonuclease/exonuclease/phosphatase family metal-dependent hydrolase